MHNFSKKYGNCAVQDHNFLQFLIQHTKTSQTYGNTAQCLQRFWLGFTLDIISHYTGITSNKRFSATRHDNKMYITWVKFIIDAIASQHRSNKGDKCPLHVSCKTATKNLQLNITSVHIKQII